MCTIIKLEPEPWGGHLVESQSHRKENWMGEGWAEVPPELVEAVMQCGGWCSLEMQDGALVGLTPTERPPEPEPVREATADEILNALLGVQQNA